MAYLIFSSFKGRELARKTLRAALVVGRSPECDICVHDILLSRKHCQFDPDGSEWVISDLASKNGTYLNDQEIGRHLLKDGETVRLGKTTITFHTGQMPRGGRAYSKPNKGRQRPSDPWAALQDTMSGFDYVKSLAEEKQRIGGRLCPVGQMPVMADGSRVPTPQPTPRNPNAYQAEDIYSLLTELASSSWDSIYMNASRSPTRPAPRPMIFNSRHPRHRPASPVDMSLQAVRISPGLLASEPVLAKPPTQSRLRRALLGMARGFVTVGQSVIVLGIVRLLGKL